jgi:hypothetical protein
MQNGGTVGHGWSVDKRAAGWLFEIAERSQ